MKFLKINFLLFALISLSTTVAQTKDPKAKQLLSEVNEKVNSYDNIQISFKYVLENESENIRQETRGKVTLQGDKYVLDILGIQRIFDGKTLYTISSEDEEVTISNEYSEEENTISPSQLFSFFESGFNYKMDIIQNKMGRKIQYIKLTPIDSETEIKYALLGIDIKTKHIYNLIEIGENNTKTTLNVLEFNTNTPLSQSFFNFDASKYSDYYINNLD
ncbi:outer membrane lipoprotein carrier protein LolA [Flavobacteriaceae bacterium]|jgi:outer membrane lipoprotein-sorting protein|nr:outer membrane lipoprotein carrier protein LolA [Flavobacteriaceae bacterium]MDC0570577.1 outer membrane lipoprotein carrier protein LolA [Flavobacteriaceae bacterium]|tara:strand:- start:642 stop:1295 length:654 start_codon:yes stop_codon:yes gene_type:complete